MVDGGLRVLDSCENKLPRCLTWSLVLVTLPLHNLDSPDLLKDSEVYSNDLPRYGPELQEFALIRSKRSWGV